MNKLAVPLREEVPVNVAVPAEAVKLPLTFREELTEKLTAVVTVPVMFREEKVFVPAPLMVFEVPLMAMVPAVLFKVPLTDRFPVMVKEFALLMVPDTVRLSKVMPVPVMVLDVPERVVVPPEEWVKDPAPEVVRLPAMVRFVVPAAVILETEIVRSLKLFVPVPLRDDPPPVKLILLVLPVKVPLFTQLPATLCEKLLPLKVVEDPMEILPLMVRAAAAVNETEVPVPIVLVRLPAMVNADPGKVFTAAPEELLSVRLPYVLAATVWLVPEYSTALVRLRFVVA